MSNISLKGYPNNNIVSGKGSFASGIGNIALNEAESSFGKYNKSNKNTIFSIGYGKSNSNRNNLFEITSDGNLYLNGIGTFNGTNPSETNSVQSFLKSEFNERPSEAPKDGRCYGRQDGVWSIIKPGGVGKKDENTIMPTDSDRPILIPEDKKDLFKGEVFNITEDLIIHDYHTYYYYKNTAVGVFSHAEGSKSTANAFYSHAEGNYTISGAWKNKYTNNITFYMPSESEMPNYTIIGNSAHAEGYSTHAYGYAAHTEGNATSASGEGSHAEGYSAEAVGEYSHAEGESTTASGNNSHAEGESTSAAGYCAHAEGESTSAAGYCAHAEGKKTSASGSFAHAEGESTTASGNNSHAEGICNVDNPDWIHMVGIGKPGNYNNNYKDLEKNAYIITREGKHYILGIGDYKGTETEIPADGSVKDLVTVLSDNNEVIAASLTDLDSRLVEQAELIKTLQQTIVALDERIKVLESK